MLTGNILVRMKTREPSSMVGLLLFSRQRFAVMSGFQVVGLQRQIMGFQ